MKRYSCSPSGKTCLIFRYDVVSLITEALSSCDVMAAGKGSNFPSSRNSAFSFSLRDLAAFLLFSFMSPRAKLLLAEKKLSSLWVHHTIIKYIKSDRRNKSFWYEVYRRSENNVVNKLCKFYKKKVVRDKLLCKKCNAVFYSGFLISANTTKNNDCHSWKQWNYVWNILIREYIENYAVSWDRK